MKLDLDLNKLSFEELKAVLVLAEKSKEQPPEPTPMEEKPFIPYSGRKGHREKFSVIEQRFNDIVAYVKSKKRPFSMNQIFKKFRIAPNGYRSKHLKEKLLKVDGIEALGKRKLVCVNPTKRKYSEEFTKRQSWIMSRASYLMKMDKFLNRENAVRRAASEWGVHTTAGDTSPSHFNWENLSKYGERIREVISQKFREGRNVNQHDFDFLAFDDTQLYQLMLVKILKSKEEVLLDLGLQGDIVLENGVLKHKK